MLIALEGAKAAVPLTIFYADIGGECPGLEYFVNGSATTSYKYWSASGVEATCDAPEVVPDFAIAHEELCPEVELDGIVSQPLFVTSQAIITHKDSTQTSISREALYFILGFGAEEGGVEPWTDPTAIFIRQENNFASRFLGTAIGVPSEAFQGNSNSSQVISAIGALAASADSTLSYVSTPAADAGGATVKTLAYQHTGQSCGYWRDSKSNTLDKANVRSGLYALWTQGRIHYRAEDDNPLVAELIAGVTGTGPGFEGVDTLQKTIESGDIPLCAMRVQREGVFGALSSFAPETPCDCLFEVIATNKLPAYCEECSGDDDCSDRERPACNFGYCEAY